MLSVVGTCMFFSGCLNHIRMNASTEVKYVGDISTRNRYYIHECQHEFQCKGIDRSLSYTNSSFRMFYPKSFRIISPKEDEINQKLQTLHPNVFDRDGKPLVLHIRNTDTWEDPPFSIFGALTLGILPVYRYATSQLDVMVEVADVAKPDGGINYSVNPIGNKVICKVKDDGARSWFFSQTARLALSTDGQDDLGGYSVHEHLFHYELNHMGYIHSNAKIAPDEKVISYAIASKLKEMEDSGAIDAALARLEARKREVERQRRIAEAQAVERRAREEAAEAKRRAQVAIEAESLRAQEASRAAMQKNQFEQVNRPPYKIIDLVREKGSEFAYTFSLELAGDASIQTFFGVQNIFANEVRTAYQMEYPNVDMSHLRVVVQPSLSNGRIVGRAEVLTIAPIALSYDASARLGRLSVRFNASQYEEARAWARKNIETLARDKNIALVSGEIPPAARFYSLGESLKDGNILEIEFKTE